MSYFLETLFGGLMSGMMYALIGLGFVLIFKASGVFNFAQGAMVLVAALSMARFSVWLPQWLGFESMILANVLAFIVSRNFSSFHPLYGTKPPYLLSNRTEPEPVWIRKPVPSCHDPLQ